jgi:uncharacterized membrane protein YkoI
VERGGVSAWFAIAGSMVAMALQGVGPAGAQAPSEQEPVERVQAVGREARGEPALGEDEVRALLRESLGVEILKIEAIESQGRPAYAVTVMNPPGNDNSAFMVETLVIDGATGGILGRVPQEPRVPPRLAETEGQGDVDNSGPEIRRRTFR